MGTPRKLDLNALGEAEGAKIRVTVESAEDDADKKVRIHKEIYSFWFKDLGPIILAGLIITGVTICCLMILTNKNSTATDRDNAWKAIAGVFGVVVGAVFGKATSKNAE